MRFFIIIGALVLFSTIGRTQVIKKDLTAVFAFQVHSIDDFFDRFNFRKNTGFQTFIKKKYPDYEMKREVLVSSLFNTLNTNLIKSPERKEFLLQVTDSLHPQFIKYNDHDWFAELRCRVLYKNKIRNLTLIVKVEKTPKNEYLWAVVSANADFLKVMQVRSDSAKSAMEKESNIQVKNTRYSLSPVSHGIDFINLENFFASKEHLHDFVSAEYYSPELNRLLLFIKKSEVKFDQINSTSYHLLQLNGWVVVVDYFNRNEKNAGWLINRLEKVSLMQKENYLKTNLNIYKR